MSGPNPNFGRLYGADPQQSRVQDNVQSVLGPLAKAVQNTPIMGAAPPAWIRPSLLNGFTAGAPFPLPAYHRDCLGYVHVKGFVTNFTGAPIAGSTDAFVLPPGYRPNEVRSFPSFDGAGASQVVGVTPSGRVRFLLAVANAGGASLELSFLAEQ